MRFLFRAFSGLLLLGITIALIGFGTYRLIDAKRIAKDAPSRVAKERIYVVNTGILESTIITPVITAYGEVQSWRSLVIRTPVVGEVVEISDAFRNGSAVRRAEQLFTIDPQSLRSQTEDAEAALAEALAEQTDADEALVFSSRELQSARKQLALRKTELERQRKLLARGLATESNISPSELAHASAEQTVVSRGQSEASARKRVERASLKIQRARISLAEARRDLDETGVFAPFDGVLSGVSLQLGQRLGVNEQVGTLLDPTALEAVFRVPNSKFSRLLDARGKLLHQTIQVDLELGERSVTVNGRIERVDGLIQQGQSGRLIYASLDTTLGSVLLPGDFVTVRINEPALEEVSIIPASAATDNGMLLGVDTSNRLHDVRVKILRRVDDRLIVKPASFGGTYVVERLPQLAAGVRVKDSRDNPSDDELLALDEGRRARLIAFVESNIKIPADRRAQTLEQLKKNRVSRKIVERIESRM
jgi:membrane fusion protein, multidrug efflux system